MTSREASERTLHRFLTQCPPEQQGEVRVLRVCSTNPLRPAKREEKHLTGHNLSLSPPHSPLPLSLWIPRRRFPAFTHCFNPSDGEHRVLDVSSPGLVKWREAQEPCGDRPLPEDSEPGTGSRNTHAALQVGGGENILRRGNKDRRDGREVSALRTET